MSLNSLPLLCFRLGPVEGTEMKRLFSIHRGPVWAERAEESSITNYLEKNDPEDVFKKKKSQKKGVKKKNVGEEENSPLLCVRDLNT